ncbi:MAG: RDD family protein [Bdellovibrionota bacterium]|nr:RDD family protein [Bdellovibrionota bacterium]
MGAREIGSDGKTQEERQRDRDEYRLENAVPGGFWIRFVAVLVDALVMIILSSLGGTLVRVLGISSKLGFDMAKLTTQDGQLSPEAMSTMMAAYSVGVIISWTIGFFYFGWFYKNKGGSPGKLILGLRVRDYETKENIGYWRAFLREYIGKLISGVLLLLGFIMAAFRSDKKALHDMLSGTQVVQLKDE